MRRVLYLSHPEVDIDPLVPVPRWGLSAVGRARLGAALARGWPGSGWQIVSSPETKARETAALIAAATGDPVLIHPDMGEVDRSSTGYLPHDRHEALADALFANPLQGPEGWESAGAAQVRII
ncbi:MAG: histidine phosphatase family protein, partial [Pseudorhodobacter sp.]